MGCRLEHRLGLESTSFLTEGGFPQQSRDAQQAGAEQREVPLEVNATASATPGSNCKNPASSAEPMLL